jgi:hypothetical protein
MFECARALLAQFILSLVRLSGQAFGPHFQKSPPDFLSQNRVQRGKQTGGGSVDREKKEKMLLGAEIA